MPTVTLNINDRVYDVTCDEGQEGHLGKLAEHIDERARDLAKTIGPIGEARLLVMTGLLIADELFEAYRQIHALRSAAPDGGEVPEDQSDDAAAAATLEACAARIEALADRLAGA